MQEFSPQIEIVNAADFGEIAELATELHRITTSEGTKLREVPSNVLLELISERRVLLATMRNKIAGVVRLENRGKSWEELCGLYVTKDFRGKELEVNIHQQPQELPSYLFDFTNAPQRELQPTKGSLAEHLMFAGLKKIYHSNHTVGLLHPLDNSYPNSGAMLVTQLLGNPKMVKLAARFGLVPLHLDGISKEKLDKGIDGVIERSIQEDLRDLVEAGNRILMFDKFHLSPEMLALAQKYREHLKKITSSFTIIGDTIGSVLENES